MTRPSIANGTRRQCGLHYGRSWDCAHETLQSRALYDTKGNLRSPGECSGRVVGNPELDCPLVSVSVWPVIQAQFCGSASDAAMAT